MMHVHDIGVSAFLAAMGSASSRQADDGLGWVGFVGCSLTVMASRLPPIRFDCIQHLSCCYYFFRDYSVAPSTRARRTFHHRTNSSLPCRRSLSRLCRKGSSFSFLSASQLAGVSFASHRLTTPAIRLKHAGGDANRRGSLSTRLSLSFPHDFAHDEASWARTSDAELVPQAHAKAYTSSAAKKPIPVID